MIVEFLDIAGDEIPAEKYFEIDGTTYLFRIRKNEKFLESENLTCEIFDLEGKLIYANKLVYGQNYLFAPHFKTKIIPLNIEKLSGISDNADLNEKTLGIITVLATGISQ